jgi:glucose/arabinose dehydrogenase
VSARLFSLLALAALVAGCGSGSSDEAAPAAPGGYRFSEVVSGLEAPVNVASVRGDTQRLYVVEQEGRIRIVQGGRITGTFLDIRSRVACCGEQGLLSVAFHPRYRQNGRYYVNYTAPANRVVEYRGRRAVRTLLNLQDPYSNHNGGQNQFGPDGRLYVGTGDSGGGGDPDDNAQDLGSRFGKLLAMNVDRRGAGWQIVGYGLRNPWRFSFDRQTGDLYIGDVGQNAWEEVDFRPRRSPGVENYGWDVYEGRARFESKPRNPRGRLIFPVATYPLSGGNCAVVGGYVYRGSAVPGARGRYFYGDNCSGTIWSLRIVRGRARDVRREQFSIPNVSSFGEGADGELYAVSLRGTLYRLSAR